MMMGKRTVRTVIALLALALIILGGILLFANSRSSGDKLLSQEEAEKTILEQYDGNIVHTTVEGHAYVVQLRSDKGLYELTIDRATAAIEAIRQIEQFTETPGKPAETPVPSETAKPSQSPPPEKSPNPSVLLEEADAINIALEKVSGTLKEVELEQEGGKWYYFVELETQDGREATVQLHAGSGKVQSVTWDDDDDEDDSD
ncbi:PepSY domain-containing protein [Paenibacillus sp. NPDC057967]|uniref:PepSY domain-containing protein n=1 Tax=Paenibacillus sp. NPDC057967 TaxID=3346293 RepID=UPI0036D83A63